MTQPTPIDPSPASIKIRPIGVVRSCFTEKFGIPRQPGLVPASTGTIHLHDWIATESLEGLAQFSHLWVFFQFHQAVKRGFKPRIRPPRLGGNTKMGVLASRSPQRPNFMGQSVVRLHRLDQAQGIIHISGLDLLDGTPVIDIKPYIPYTDCVPEASEGYAPKPVQNMRVVFAKECLHFCAEDDTSQGRNLKQLIEQILEQDPRPAYHQDDRQYGMRLWDLDIHFTCNNNVTTVCHIQRDRI